MKLLEKKDFEIFRYAGNTDMKGDYKVSMKEDRTWCGFDWLNRYKRKELYMDEKEYKNFKKTFMEKYPLNRFLSGMRRTSNGRMLFRSD